MNKCKFRIITYQIKYLLLIGFIYFILGSNICWAEKFTVNITFSGVENGAKCAAFQTLMFHNKPVIETSSKDVSSRVDDVLQELGSKPWSAKKFAQKLLLPLGKVKGPTCVDRECEGSSCIKTAYELTTVPPPPPTATTTIIINPHYSVKDVGLLTLRNPEQVIPLTFQDNISPEISNKYNAEAHVLGALTEVQIAKLQYVSGEIAKAAYSEKIFPSELPTTDRVKKLEDYLIAQFDLDVFDRLMVKVIKNYSIELDNFPLVDDQIDVYLTNWHQRIEELRSQGQEDAAKKYEAKTQQREREISKEFQRFLPNVSVLTTSQLLGAQKAYEKKSKARFTENTIQGMGLDNRLVLAANEPARYFEIVSSVGGRYSTGTNLQGTLSFDVNNLLNLDDSLTASGSWGVEAEEGKLGWKGSVASPNDERFSGDFSIAGSYSKDRRSPLGQLSTTTIMEKTWSTEVTATAMFDSFLQTDHGAFEGQSADRKMIRYWFGYTLGLSLKKFATSESATLNLDNITNSIVNGLSFGVTRDLHYTDASYLSHITANLRAKNENGVKILVGDETFNKTSGVFLLEVYLGDSKDARDFFIRGLGRGGRASEDTPYSALFQLGGVDGVRGLETTELTGNTYWGATEEVGIRLSRFFPRQQKDAAIDLSAFYIKLFHDWIHSEGSNLPVPSVNRMASVNGYGIAVEITKIMVGKNMGSFAFGYAFSPDSKLNRGGTISAEFRTDF